MTDLTDNQLLTAAHEALTRPRDFGYWGEKTLFESWGLTFTQNRDSEAETRSNYRRILADLTDYAREHELLLHDADPTDYVTDFRSDHWAWGWEDTIIVRVLQDENGPVEVDNLTETFVRATEIAFELQEESVYDVNDLANLEDEEDWGRFETEWDRMVRNWDVESEGALPVEEEKHAVHAKLTEYETPQGYDEDEMAEILKNMRPAPESANEHIVDDPNQARLF